MVLLRKLILAQMRWGFVFVTEHLKSEDNDVADALSRFQDVFWDRAPQAKKELVTLPISLLPLSRDTWKSYLF